jgi:hypothetical protein
MAKSKAKHWAVGRWLIESMDQWDREFIDEAVRGYFEFDSRGSGAFQFGYVEGQRNMNPSWSGGGLSIPKRSTPRPPRRK